MFTISIPRFGRQEQVEDRAIDGGTWGNPSGEVIDLLTGGPPVAGGVRVNENNAMQMVAVYAAIRVLAEGVASLPFHLYEQNENGRVRLNAKDDPRAALLDDSPNPEQTAFELWEQVMGHLCLWGNAYMYREINQGNGLTQSLWPLMPDKTSPFRDTQGNKWYGTVTTTGERRIIDPNEIIHVKAFSTSADLGISPIGRARQAIGIGIAADQFAGKFFETDGRPGGIIKYAGSPSDEKFEQMVNRWKQAHQGLNKSHLVGILTGGGEWQDVGFPSEDALFVAGRQFQVEEIGRLFRVPGHMLQSTQPGAVSYASVEQFSRDFVDFSLRPWLVRIEQQIKRAMFSSSVDKAKGRYPEFKVDGLLRGDAKTRSEVYSMALGKWMDANEIRELENLPRDEKWDTPTPAPESDPSTNGFVPVPAELPQAD